jgi:hypothetical protein
MQKILFAKVEAWLVLLLLLLGILASVFFGSLVLNTVEGKSNMGRLGRGAVALAGIPNTIDAILKSDQQMMAFLPDRFAGQPAGWTMNPGAGALPDGYLLVSRYDGDRRRHVVELVNLADRSVVHAWLPDAAELLADVPRTSHVADYTLWNTRSYRIIHPWLADNGDLIMKDHHSALFRIDACGKRVWKNDEVWFHHSTESDGEGGLWIPALIEPQTVKGVPQDFYEDAVAHVSAEGRILYLKSLTQMFLDHGLQGIMFTSGTYDSDPVHLNDVQPVLADGPYWKKGDLFLSFRRQSMLVLYRPATDEIIWMKRGPWMAQHDVDVLDTTRIAVFDNATENRGKGQRVAGSNQIVIYDFATDTISRPYEAAMRDADVKTQFEGLFTLFADGRLFVEEENSGRLLFFAKDGRIIATYLNKGSDDKSYRLGWSRYIDKATGDAVAARLDGTSCAAPG